MSETEDLQDDAAFETVSGSSRLIRPEDAVGAAMDEQRGEMKPILEAMVAKVDFGFPEDEETAPAVAERADRVMMFLRSMMTDFRQRFPRALEGMADAAVKAHFLAALHRTRRVSHNVRDAVLKIIDKRCR